jgi:hypothetical protein
MDLTRQDGFHKWNTTSPSMILGMMRPNSMWGFCTWIKKDGNGGNGIRNVIQAYPLGPCSPKRFVPILIGNPIFWVDSPSSNKQGSVTNFITTFEQLAIHTEGLSDEFYLECFISGLKDAIKAHVCMHHPGHLVAGMPISQGSRDHSSGPTPMHTVVPNHPHPGDTSTLTQTLKVQKVSPTEMVERRKQGLFYYCDDKYSSGHKCHEQNFFQIDASTSTSSEDIPSYEAPDQEDAQPSVHLEDSVATPVEPVEPVISLHALSGISAPQTLKIKGYIKHRLVVVLIDSGSTHNFIHRRLAEELHCFVHPVSNFQILIANGGTMKCGGHCENVKLQMGDYHLKTHMFSISMGGCDIVLGVEWLHTLGPITMDYQDLYMSFTQEAHPYTL